MHYVNVHYLLFFSVIIFLLRLYLPSLPLGKTIVVVAANKILPILSR